MRTFFSTCQLGCQIRRGVRFSCGGNVFIHIGALPAVASFSDTRLQRRADAGREKTDQFDIENSGWA